MSLSITASNLFNRRYKHHHEVSMTGSPYDFHRIADHRRASVSSDSSTGSDFSKSSATTDSLDTCMTDEDAAFLLLALTNNNTPFATPTLGAKGLPYTDDALSFKLPEPIVPAPASTASSPFSMESSPEPSPEPSSDPVSPPKTTKFTAANKKKANIKVKAKAKAKSKTRMAKVKAASPSPSPPARTPRIQPEVDISDLCAEDQAEVKKRPNRDQNKAAKVCRWRLNKDEYYEVDEPCDRCAKSGWQCFKRIPQASNNKPGPAPGHGRGCVTCHKSACSFAKKKK